MHCVPSTEESMTWKNNQRGSQEAFILWGVRGVKTRHESEIRTRSSNLDN